MTFPPKPEKWTGKGIDFRVSKLLKEKLSIDADMVEIDSIVITLKLDGEIISQSVTCLNLPENDIQHQNSNGEMEK